MRILPKACSISHTGLQVGASSDAHMAAYRASFVTAAPPKSTKQHCKTTSCTVGSMCYGHSLLHAYLGTASQYSLLLYRVQSCTQHGGRGGGTGRDAIRMVQLMADPQLHLAVKPLHCPWEELVRWVLLTRLQEESHRIGLELVSLSDLLHSMADRQPQEAALQGCTGPVKPRQC